MRCITSASLYKQYNFAGRKGIRTLMHALIYTVTLLPGPSAIKSIMAIRNDARKCAKQELMKGHGNSINYDCRLSEIDSDGRQRAQDVDAHWVALARILIVLRSLVPLRSTTAANMLHCGVVRIVARLVHQLLQLESVIMQCVNMQAHGNSPPHGEVNLSNMDRYNDGDTSDIVAREAAQIQDAMMTVAAAATHAPTESWLSAIAVTLEIATGFLCDVLESSVVRAKIFDSAVNRVMPAASAADMRAGSGQEDLLEILMMATSTALAEDMYTREILRTIASKRPPTPYSTAEHRPVDAASVLPSGQRLVRRGATQHLLDMTVNLTSDERVKALTPNGWQPGASLLAALLKTLRVAVDDNFSVSPTDGAEYSAAGPEFGFGVGVRFSNSTAAEIQLSLTVHAVASAYREFARHDREFVAANEQLMRERKKLNELSHKKTGSKGGKGATVEQTLPQDLVERVQILSQVRDVAQALVNAKQLIAIQMASTFAGFVAAPFIDDLWGKSVKSYLANHGVQFQAMKSVSIGKQLRVATSESISMLHCSVVQVLSNLAANTALCTRLAAPSMPDEPEDGALVADNDDGNPIKGGSIEIVTGIVLRACFYVLSVPVFDRWNMTLVLPLTPAPAFGVLNSHMKLLHEALHLLMAFAVAAGVESATRIVTAAPALPWALFALLAPSLTGTTSFRVTCSGLYLQLMMCIAALLSRLATGNLAVRDDLLARNGIGLMLGTGIASIAVAAMPENSQLSDGNNARDSFSKRSTQQEVVTRLDQLI